jgi:carbonic anhydrase
VSVALRDEAADSPASRELFGEYMELIASRLGTTAAAYHAREDIFGTPEELADWLVLYLDGRPSGCAGLRPGAEGVVEIKRMFVTERARGEGHGRALLRALEALYAAEGYVTVATPTEGARQDYWMEKPLG